jgi:hypothetical protein
LEAVGIVEGQDAAQVAFLAGTGAESERVHAGVEAEAGEMGEAEAENGLEDGKRDGDQSEEEAEVLEGAGDGEESKESEEESEPLVEAGDLVGAVEDVGEHEICHEYHVSTGVTWCQWWRDTVTINAK